MYAAYAWIFLIVIRNSSFGVYSEFLLFDMEIYSLAHVHACTDQMECLSIGRYTLECTHHYTAHIYTIFCKNIQFHQIVQTNVYYLCSISINSAVQILLK